MAYIALMFGYLLDIKPFICIYVECRKWHLSAVIEESVYNVIEHKIGDETGWAWNNDNSEGGFLVHRQAVFAGWGYPWRLTTHFWLFGHSNRHAWIFIYLSRNINSIKAILNWLTVQPAQWASH